MASPTDFDALFVGELTARQVDFDALGDGTYLVRVRGRELTVNTNNARAEFARDRDPGAVGRFVCGVLGAEAELFDWPQVVPSLFPMIESIDVDLGAETLSRDLSSRTKVVLASHWPGSGSVRFLSTRDLDTWGVSEQEVWDAARSVFDVIVSKTVVEILRRGDLLLGAVHAQEPYKASMILSARLKHQIPAELGWPVLAVAPARDFVYLLRKGDERSLGRVGAVVVREFAQSGYPVSTEVWELSDDGAVAVGEFPVQTLE